MVMYIVIHELHDKLVKCEKIVTRAWVFHTGISTNPVDFEAKIASTFRMDD
jgi:hypothetical protein